MPRPPVMNPTDTKANRLSSPVVRFLFSPRQRGRNPLKLMSRPPCGVSAPFFPLKKMITRRMRVLYDSVHAFAAINVLLTTEIK